MTELATVLIPAWNEASVIGRTLTNLQNGLARGRLRLIVIANACSDDTAAIARQAAPDALVLETPIAGKCQALSLGLTYAAPARPVVCLDADLDVTAAEVLALIAPLLDGIALAARVFGVGQRWAGRGAARSAACAHGAAGRTAAQAQGA